MHAGTGEVEIAERMVTLKMVALGRLLGTVPAEADLREQRRVVFGVAQQVARLRQSEASMERVRLAREKWESAEKSAEGDGWRPLLTPEERLAKYRKIFGISDPPAEAPQRVGDSSGGGI